MIGKEESSRHHDHAHQHSHGHEHGNDHRQLSPSETTPLTNGSPLRKGSRKYSLQLETRTPLNVSDNVLLGYRANDLKNMAWNNFVVAILCLVYTGLNISLIYFNYVNSSSKTVGDEPPVDKHSFHMTEFWGTFFFGLIELFAIMQTPKHLVSTVQSPRLLKIILFANVVMTLVPAVMVSINLDEFEILAHELEYCSEITMSFLELVLLRSLLRRNTAVLGDEEGEDESNVNNTNSLVLATIALTIALVQLGVYNLMGQTSTGGMAGEVPAHYCEFTFEIISSMITCWFAMDNMFIADEELSMILFGDHSDCIVCATHAVPGPMQKV